MTKVDVAEQWRLQQEVARQLYKDWMTHIDAIAANAVLDVREHDSSEREALDGAIEALRVSFEKQLRSAQQGEPY